MYTFKSKHTHVYKSESEHTHITCINLKANTHTCVYKFKSEYICDSTWEKGPITLNQKCSVEACLCRNTDDFFFCKFFLFLAQGNIYP